MKCKAIHNKIIFFVEKELPVSEMKQIREHINNCPNCALFAKDLQKTLRILDSEKVVEENPFFYTRVKVRLENQEKEVVAKRPILARILQPVAFSIILLFGVYGGIKLGQPYNAQLSESSLSENQIIPYLNEMDAEPIETFLME